MARLIANPFPGNVRELENIICRAVLLCRGDTIGLEHLPPRMSNSGAIDKAATRHSFHQAKATAVEEFERLVLTTALRECGGLVNRAAKRTGLSERNFHAKLKRYGISGRSFRGK